MARALPTIQHVIFDWNGTLLDDFALALATVNTLRDDHALPHITHAEYRRAFRFPIRAFYASIGFDVDDAGFPALMARYLARFNAAVDACPLHAGARETVAQLRQAAIGVHILSASHHETLATSLRAYALHDAFDHVAGLGHQLATTKLALGAELAQRLDAPPASVLYVGDTDHDHEVAHAQGWKFLFVDHGHQAAVPSAAHCTHTLTALDDILHHLHA